MEFKLKIKETLAFMKKHETDSGDNYFKALSGFLFSIMKIDFIMIDNFFAEKSEITQTQVFFPNGEVEKIKHRKFSEKQKEKFSSEDAIIQNNVSELFEDDKILKELGAISGITIVIDNSSNEPIAFFSGYSKNKIEDIETLKIIFEILSLRIKTEAELYFIQSNFIEIEPQILNTKSIINNLPLGLAILRMNGEILFQNKMLDKITGKDVFEKKCEDKYKFSLAQCQKCIMFEDFKEENYKEFEIDNFGNQVSVRVIQKTMTYKGEKIILEIFQDVSLLHLYQKQLVNSEEKFRVAFKNSPDSINLNKLDGTYVEINDGFTKIMGYNNEDVVGLKSTELNIWANPKDREKLVAGLKEKGIVENLEAEFITKTTDKKHGLMSAVIINLDNEPHILSITRDITERKKIENELLRLNQEYESINEELRQTNDDLNKSKEIIEENQRNHKLIFDNSPMGLLYYDINGVIVDCNDKFVEIIGSSREVLIGICMLNLPDKKIVESLNQALEGNTGIYDDYYHSTTANKVTPVHVAFAPAYSDKREVIGGVGIVEDVTERKEYEKELKKLQKALEKSINEVYIFNSENLKFSYLNQSALKNIGYSIEEMQNMTPADIDPEINKEEFLKLIEPLLIGEKETLVFETIHKRKDGSTYPVEISLNIFKFKDKKEFLAIINDITERKEYEKELLKEREKLKEAQEISHTGYWEFDLVQDKIEWSEELFRILGFKPGEIRSTYENYNAYIHPEDRELSKGAFKKSLKTREDYEIEYRLLLKNNEVKYVKEKCRSEYDENGRAIRSIGTIIDITEQKKYENEIIEAKEKAEESEKLKTAFLQNMSHEIRTPLNGIMGFAELLNKPGLSEQTIENYISIILKSGKQLLSIVNDILTISSLETNQAKINKSDVCVNEIIMELMSTFDIQAKNQNISLYPKQNLTDEESIIHTDKTKLMQVLCNLLSNAIKFTKKGYVEFGYILKTYYSKPYLEFYVKDTGIGIENVNFEKIFERFRQAEEDISNKYGGTGLGLAISKSFVEKLGGDIRVESEPGKGSTFYFTLPYNNKK